MARGTNPIFVLLACFVLVAARDDCTNDPTCAASGSHDRVQLLQTASSLEGAEITKVEAEVDDVDFEHVVAEMKKTAQVDDDTLKLVMAEMKRTKSTHINNARSENLEWHFIRAIEGAKIQHTFGPFVPGGPTYGPFSIRVTDGYCQADFEKATDGKCPDGCVCSDIAPAAVAACKGLSEGARCELVDQVKREEKQKNGKMIPFTATTKITSICADTDHDGTSVCLPYVAANCFISQGGKDPYFFPKGTYCTTHSGTGSFSSGNSHTGTGPSKGHTDHYTLGTCDTNTGWDKKSKPIKCVGAVEYTK